MCVSSSDLPLEFQTRNRDTDVENRLTDTAGTEEAQPGAPRQARGVGCGGKEVQERGAYVYLRLIHADVRQKPTQHCKGIILPLKINKKNKTCITLNLCECHFDTGESFQFLPGRGELENERTLTPEGPSRREMKVWFRCLASKAGGSRELHQPSFQLDQFSVKTEKPQAAQVKFPLHRFQFNDIPVSR